MEFELFCMTSFALLFSLAFTFFGYRLFLILLPIWGFFFGLGLGAQTLQVLFGVGFLATVTSWVAGFILGAIFASLSYLFYLFAVAILSFSFGYGLSVVLFDAIGLEFGLLVWLIGIVIGGIITFAVVRYNIQKYAIMAVTAFGGTSAVIFTLLAAFGNFTPLELLLEPVRLAIENSFWWLLFYVVLSVAGIAVQLISNQNFEVIVYNRLERLEEAPT